VTLTPDQTLADAKALTERYGFTGFPVVDEKKHVVGIVTNRDMRFAQKDDTPVRVMMTSENLAILQEPADRDEAISLMRARRIEKLLVTDAAGKLTGLLTLKDTEKAVVNPSASKDRLGRLLCAAASGVGESGFERTEALVDAGVDIVVIDTAHGHSQGVLEAVSRAKQLSNELQVIAGNVATADATRALIEAEAKRHKYILVPEPACPDGGAVIGRYAIARFNLQTRGKPSHAGWALKDGVSAIAEMAKHVAVIEGMTSDDCTFSLGVFNAGQWVNCVSSVCDAEVLSMAKTQEQLDAGIAKMMALNADQGNVVMEVTRGVTRPVWEPDQPGTMAMLRVAQEISRELGFEMTGQSAGGGSDGNFTGYLGLPTLDSIGVRGQGLHTLNEHIEVDSLVERAKLAAGLYCRLGA